jgi:ketosteroid isomerase-like protein
MATLWHEVMRAWNSRDFERMHSMLTDDIVLRTDPDWPGGGEFRGKAELDGFLQEFMEPWREIQYEVIEKATRHGDRLVERGRWSGSGRSSGIQGTIEFTNVVSFEGALVSRNEVFVDHQAALSRATDAS